MLEFYHIELRLLALIYRMDFSVYKTTKKKRRGQLIPKAFPFFFQRHWLALVLSQDAAILELNKTGEEKAF